MLAIPASHPALDELSSTERAIADKALAFVGERPLLWAVVTGTHQYGFVSADGDIDVRGTFAVPTPLHLGLTDPPGHVSYDGIIDGREVDCLAFEVGRFVKLVLKHSGNVVEELFSPLVLVDGGHLTAFREAVMACLTRGIARHYIGFFEACVKKLRNKHAPEVKTALYAVRIALTGITLLTEARVEAHLPTLNERFGLDYVDEWIALKVGEHEPLPDDRLDEVLDHLGRLRKDLLRATRESVLPEEPQALDRLSDLLVQVRLQNL